MKTIRPVSIVAAMVTLALLAGMRLGSVRNNSEPDSIQVPAPAKEVDLTEAFAQAAEALQPSVVRILASRTVHSPLGQEEERSGGTGVIVDADGIVLTNHHVIKDADTIFVTLHDGRTLVARTLGTDADTDLAALKIQASGLRPAEFGDSDQLRAGQWLLAIGHPLGLNRTVTVGIVSATGRRGLGINEVEDFVQTDAAINSGNSGGPLINLKGQVVGINDAILSPNGGSIGLGMSISANLAQRVLRDLVRYGHIKRSWLGLDTEEPNEFAIGDDPKGARIERVDTEGPAANAGLRADDVVVRFGGKEIRTEADLQTATALAEPGDEVGVEVVRDGERHVVTLRLSEAPLENSDTPQVLGLTLRELSAREAERSGFPQLAGAAIIASVESGSTAEESGLRRGDIVLGIDDQALVAAELEEALADLDTRVSLLVLRDGRLTLVMLEPGR